MLAAALLFLLAGPVITYTADGLVQAASGQRGALAPNTIVTLYGSNLSYETRAVTASDLKSGSLPVSLPGTGVRVIVGSYVAPLYYVSPTQINFLVPAQLTGPQTTVQVFLDGRVGPMLTVPLVPAAPGLFRQDEHALVAVRADGRPVLPDDPAQGGEVLVFYGTGLGQTILPVTSGQLATEAMPVAAKAKVRLNGVELPPENVHYVGLTPGFAGLYQVNLKLPESATGWQEVRVVIGETASPGGMGVPAK